MATVNVNPVSPSAIGIVNVNVNLNQYLFSSFNFLAMTFTLTSAIVNVFERMFSNEISQTQMLRFNVSWQGCFFL